jgi:hypothetical protein
VVVARRLTHGGNCILRLWQLKNSSSIHISRARKGAFSTRYSEKTLARKYRSNGVLQFPIKIIPTELYSLVIEDAIGVTYFWRLDGVFDGYDVALMSENPVDQRLTPDWLRNKIKNDPDDESCDAGLPDHDGLQE